MNQEEDYDDATWDPEGARVIADMEARRPRAVEFIQQFVYVGTIVQYGLMALVNPELFKDLQEEADLP